MFDYVCVSSGEGARNPKGSAARQCRHTLNKTSYLPNPTKGALVFGEQPGRLAPLKAMTCPLGRWHGTPQAGHFFASVSASE